MVIKDKTIEPKFLINKLKMYANEVNAEIMFLLSINVITFRKINFQGEILILGSFS